MKKDTISLLATERSKFRIYSELNGRIYVEFENPDADDLRWVRIGFKPETFDHVYRLMTEFREME